MSTGLDTSNFSFSQAWPRGYKTIFIFILNSAEHELYPANNY